ncbi:hypothetical protein ACWDPP_34105, partial [Streptomyces sp. NPDC000851]
DDRLVGRLLDHLGGHLQGDGVDVAHENLADEAERADAASGWAAVLSNLKSLLETGSPLPEQPWLVPNR